MHYEEKMTKRKDEQWIDWPVRKDEIDERDDQGLYLVLGSEVRYQEVSAARGYERISIGQSATNDGLVRFYNAGIGGGTWERDGHWLVLPSSERAKPPGQRVWTFVRYGSGSGVVIGCDDFATDEELNQILSDCWDKDGP